MLEKSQVDPKDIAGLSLSGQMHGLVLVDDQGKALGRSIIWCDNRTIESCDEFTRLVGGREELIRISANPALTGFTAGRSRISCRQLSQVSPAVIRRSTETEQESATAHRLGDVK